jgi:hypothetical protein
MILIPEVINEENLKFLPKDLVTQELLLATKLAK